MGVVQEFKSFALKGNVVDLAVGIIIGAAFGKIVSSLVADVVMPPLGLLIGGLNFTDIKIDLGHNLLNAASKPVTLNIGNFIQTVFDFTIVAFSIFLLVKGINSAKKKQDEAAAASTKDQELLTEIRDLLKKK